MKSSSSWSLLSRSLSGGDWLFSIICCSSLNNCIKVCTGSITSPPTPGNMEFVSLLRYLLEMLCQRHYLSTESLNNFKTCVSSLFCSWGGKDWKCSSSQISVSEAQIQTKIYQTKLMLFGIPRSQTCRKQEWWKPRNHKPWPAFLVPFKLWHLYKMLGEKVSMHWLATHTQGIWRDKCYHRWEQGSSACQWAVLPKLFPNPTQSHERTPSMNTMGTTAVSFLSFCLPVRYHTWIRGKR